MKAEVHLVSGAVWEFDENEVEIKEDKVVINEDPGR